MKKLKLSMSSLKGAILSREELKTLIGGDDTSFDCQSFGSPCNTQTGSNCCSGLKCADNVCHNPGF